MAIWAANIPWLINSVICSAAPAGHAWIRLEAADNAKAPRPFRLQLSTPVPAGAGSLDEAYLDVTENIQGILIATEIATMIRARLRGDLECHIFNVMSAWLTLRRVTVAPSDMI